MSGTGAGNMVGFQTPITDDDDEESKLREAVRNIMTELVRRKPGGGGYVLFSPNKGKKKLPKSVGEFPTRAAARKAELARFPPKDAERLKRLRKEIDKMQKDPERRQERDSADMKKPYTVKRKGAPARVRPKVKESLQRQVTRTISEALFEDQEETGSGWEERLSSMSATAVASDGKLQSLQKAIEKQTASALDQCVKHVTKALKSIGKVKSDGIKKDEQRQKTYVKMTVDVGGVAIGPIYVFVEDGKPLIEVSGEAKSSLGRLEPEDSKALRAELVAAQEDAFGDAAEGIQAAVRKRDQYLEKVQSGVDGWMSDMTALELTMMKSLANQKYRGKR